MNGFVFVRCFRPVFEMISCVGSSDDTEMRCGVMWASSPTSKIHFLGDMCVEKIQYPTCFPQKTGEPRRSAVLSDEKPSAAVLSWRGRAMKLRRKNSRSYETAVFEQSVISSDVVLQRRFELRTPCLKGRCSAY